MKPDEIKNLVEKATPLPPPEASVVERARYRALTAFRNASPASPPRRALFWRWALAGGVGVAILAASIPLITPPLKHSVPDGRRLLDELEILFPRQLDAVLVRDGEVSLVLSEQPVERPADQRVQIPLPGNGVLLGYSGTTVRVGGREITALVSGNGKAFAVDADGSLYGGHRL